MVTKYTIIDPRNMNGGPTAICLEERPEHIARHGLTLNLPGGKLQDGETYRECAERELLEETSYVPYGDILDMVGLFEGPTFEIAVFTGPVDNRVLPYSQDSLKPVYWYDWDTVRVDTRLFDDLKIIVPLIREAPPGWIATKDEAGRLFIAYDQERPFPAE